MNKNKMTVSDIQQDFINAIAHIQWMETSKFWKCRSLFHKVRQKLKKICRRPMQINNPHYMSGLGNPFVDKYLLWQHQNFPRDADLKRLTETIDFFPLKPLISIIIPTYNSPRQFLEEAIESVLDQIYPYWEICIADDASTVPHVKEILERYQQQDSRIKITFRSQNGHISRCSNSALELASGEYIALLDHDDLLTPNALYEIALLINRHPEADMVYSDEDKVSDVGILSAPYFKPDWCPDSFLARMYICHFGVYRRSIIQKIGGFRAGYEGSQDYDLVLRFTEQTQKIFHIPQILYHWRIHPESAASGVEAKPYAYCAAQKAITDAIHRRGEPGTVSQNIDSLGSYTIRYKIQEFKLVSIILIAQSDLRIIDRCLKSIFLTTAYPSYEVLIIVDLVKITDREVQILDRWKRKEPERIRIIPFQNPHHNSESSNYGVQNSRGEYILFLSEQVVVKQSDWMSGLVEHAQRNSIGAVGVKLVSTNGLIRHAGILMGVGGVFGYSHQDHGQNTGGYFNHVGTVNNYAAVSGACLMCRQDIFNQVDGLDPTLAQEYNYVDLCLKFLAIGYVNVYVSHITLHLYGDRVSDSRLIPEKELSSDTSRVIMQEKWESWIDCDPYYSPNLAKNQANYSLNI